jgi:hypothetical protein
MNLSLCIQIKDDVFKLDDRIRYFGFMDNRQGMIVSELRDPSDSHPGESQLVRDLTFFKGAMASWSIYFGHVKYAIVCHDAINIIMIPVEAGLVIVTTESSFPVEHVENVGETVRRLLL